MIVDFNNRPEEVLEHFNGGEKEFIVRRYLDDKCKIMKGYSTAEPRLASIPIPQTANLSTSSRVVARC